MNVNLIPENELGKGSGIKLAVCDTEHDLYWRMAIDVLETIQKNNENDEDTIMVIPYGPLGPYSRLVYLVNKYRVSLKRCTFINMDEYLTDDLKYIDVSDPLSFKGAWNGFSTLRLMKNSIFFPKTGISRFLVKNGV